VVSRRLLRRIKDLLAVFNRLFLATSFLFKNLLFILTTKKVGMCAATTCRIKEVARLVHLTTYSRVQDLLKDQGLGRVCVTRQSCSVQELENRVKRLGRLRSSGSVGSALAARWAPL
jgi:hypothetical protein